MILNLDHQASNSPVLNLDPIAPGIELRLNDSVTIPSVEIQTFQWPGPAVVQNISIPWTGLGLFVLVITSGGVIWVFNSGQWSAGTDRAGINIGGQRIATGSFEIVPPEITHQELEVQTEEQQTNQVPTVPVHKPGDTYTIQSINLDTGTPNNTTERKVVFANSEKLVVESRNITSKTGAVRQLEFTPEWNLIVIRNADGSWLDYSPPLKYYEFPLNSGKTWKQTSVETNIKTGATREHTLSAVVGDWEAVTVPAGTFSCVKVTIQTELLDHSTGQKTTGIDTSWYVPEVRRSVRSLTSSKSPEGVQSRQEIQLIKYDIEK